MAGKEKAAETKGRRVSIDLTPAATAEVDRLRELTGLTTVDMFRYALHLFRMYVDERGRGKQLFTADAEGGDRTQIELPLVIGSTTSTPQRNESAATKR